MKKSLPVFVGSFVPILVIISFGASNLRAQGAAEYSLGTSKVATGAAGLGTALNGNVSKTLDRASDNLKASTHESPAKVMQENRFSLEKQAGDGGGVLNIVSDPDDAAVFVDGKLVARTPVEIKVPSGEHEIMVTRPDRDPWSKKLKITKGQKQEISAQLVNTNPSVISLGFPGTKKR